MRKLFWRSDLAGIWASVESRKASCCGQSWIYFVLVLGQNLYLSLDTRKIRESHFRGGKIVGCSVRKGRVSKMRVSRQRGRRRRKKKGTNPKEITEGSTRAQVFVQVRFSRRCGWRLFPSPSELIYFSLSFIAHAEKCIDYPRYFASNVTRRVYRSTSALLSISQIKLSTRTALNVAISYAKLSSLRPHSMQHFDFFLQKKNVSESRAAIEWNWGQSALIAVMELWKKNCQSL